MDKKVGSRIDKPVYNVDECEHDKKRMQESRAGEIASRKERHNKALTDKDNELTRRTREQSPSSRPQKCQVGNEPEGNDGKLQMRRRRDRRRE